VTNTPRSRLEKGQNFIVVAFRLVVAQLYECAGTGVVVRCQAQEQARGHERVIGRPVGREAGGKAVSKRQGCNQRAELVAHAVRHEPLGKLERVEDLWALPLSELALKYAHVHVRVVGDYGANV